MTRKLSAEDAWICCLCISSDFRFGRTMDDFGVLTQSMGIKPQGKAAPMAALKQSSRPAYHQPNSMIQSFSDSDGFDDVFGAGYGKASNGSGGASGNSFNYDSVSKSFGGSFYDAGDVFDGMPGFKSAGSPDYDDVFGSFGGSQTAPVDGLFGATAEGSTVSRNGSSGSGKISSASFDNLISGFGGATAKSNGINLNTSVNQQAKKSTSNQLDDPFIILKTTSGNMYPDLLDQLGRLGTSRSTNLHHSSSSGSLYDNTDPFDIFHNADVKSSSSVGLRESNKANSTRPASSSPPSTSPPPRPTKKAESVKNPTASSIDELEDFAMGRMQHTAAKKSDNIKKKDGSNSAAAAFTATWKGKEGSHFSGSTESPHMSRKKSEDADFLFGMGSHFNKNRVAEDAASLGNHHKSADDLEFNFGTSRSNSAPRARNTNLNTAFGNLFQDSGKHEQARKVTSTTPSSRKKATPNTNLVDDFSSLFGPGLSGDFQDIDGEPEERRKARLGRHYRIQDRVAQAVADMNERDLQSQREQEERQRIADSLDADIKRWAAGKEGNLRALLSSMQYVVWADCGWEPVSLTDLITSSSVKKVYRKATLFVHPDKVQQKGANLQQKYIAEKVFDILKEAYNKFKANEMS